MARKRILFVDDEPLVLQALKRSLYQHRQVWDMGFAEGGVQALEMMAAQPFDVLVTDMRMPGMDGAALLDEVMRRHPDTLRLILSGHADRDLLIQCANTAHRYLSKPCDPLELQRTLEFVAHVGESLDNEALRRLVARMARIPSMPEIYGRIVEMLQDPNAGLDEVADVISRDLGTTAGILKMVNSAYFGLPSQVTDVTEAVRFLGLDVVKSLVLAVGAFEQFKHIDARTLSVAAVWQHSLRVAALAKTITREEKVAAKMHDAAFVAGLLHDAGKLVCAANFPTEYEEVADLVRREKVEWHVAEKRILHANHAEVAGSLLGLWGLPAAVVEAIALHHAPGGAPQGGFSALAAVHVANVLVHEQTPGEHDGPPPGMDEAYLARLGVAGRVPAWRTLAALPPGG